METSPSSRRWTARARHGDPLVVAKFHPPLSQIGLSPVGPSRANLLHLRASDPVLVLTQYVRHANRLFYLAKCLIAVRRRAIGRVE